jgi:hypothetical protein
MPNQQSQLLRHNGLRPQIHAARRDVLKAVYFDKKAGGAT